jgi:iron complex outermembrane receptor protein
LNYFKLNFVYEAVFLKWGNLKMKMIATINARQGLSGILFAALAITLVGVPSLSYSQILEEIIVTAQKRDENLQDVPIAVTAFTGDQIKALGFTDYVEITQQMPGLQLNAWSPNLTIFNIRGVSQNNFQDHLEAPVAVYMDDAYMGTMNGISGQMFDMKRIEVLRGPQGTLFGRNATGGLIHYLSQDASAEETNGYVEVEAGDYGRGGFEFALGGSFSDTVRARIAGRWMEMDGYIESVDTVFPDGSGVLFEGSGQDIGGLDGFALRATMQVDFSDALQGNFWLKYSEDNDVPTGGYVFEDCSPFDADGLCPVDSFGRAATRPGVIDLFEQPTDEHLNYGEYPGTLDRESTSFTARFDYSMQNGMEFVSITNYMELDKFYDEDGDALAVPILTFNTSVDWTQFSQEFRLSGDTDSSRWQVGFFYLDMENDGSTGVTGAPGFGNIVASGRILDAGGVDTALATAEPFNGFEGANGVQFYLLESRNWSIFGQSDFDLNDQWTLTAGLRWSQDDKEIDWRLVFGDNFNMPPVLITTEADLAAVNPGVDEIDYGDWAGRLALSYSVSDSTMLFGSINRGIKGGNWSLGVGANITPDSFQHNEEVLWSYEVGFKTEADSYRLNGTIYFYDYEDYQAFSLAGGAPLVANSDASSFGGELEFFWYPNENWDIILGAAFIDSEVDEVIGVSSVIDPGGSATNTIQNAEFPNAPGLSLNYLFRYNWDIGSGNIAAQIDGVWNDDQFLEVTNGTGTVQKSYNVSNARLSYATRENKFNLIGWVRNFTDETYKQYSLDLGVLGATTYYAPPITYGVTARINF